MLPSRFVNELPEESIENETSIKEEDEFNINQDSEFEIEQEYRSPGWDRLKRNKMLKWKINKLKNFFKYLILMVILLKNNEYFGEYIDEDEDNLKFISDFTGSYGFALILKKQIIYL